MHVGGAFCFSAIGHRLSAIEHRPSVIEHRLSESNMDYSKLGGLIPAVAQDATSGEVLMVGFMNEEAFAKTRETGFATFFSRSRNELWTKGETSGNRLQVVEMLVDCDDDTVLMKVRRLGDGNVCHTGTRTCFRTL
jgi:phosphoribosyl-AMP cyclohydrolase